MRIGRAEISGVDGWARLTAHVETLGRSHSLYFEVPESRASLLTERTDPFLPSVAVLAPLIGEFEIEIAQVDPDLLAGVTTALDYLGKWYPEEYPKRLSITSSGASEPIVVARKAGSFMTGGIDSLATMRFNHLTHAPSHPFRIATGVLVNLYAGSVKDEHRAMEEHYSNYARHLRSWGEGLGVDMVEVRTNVGSLVDYETWRGWGRARHGMFFSGAAHALSGGLHSVRIASGAAVRDPDRPWGSHPLIDNELWSASLRVIHDGLHLNRPEKSLLVAQWPEAHSALNVCTRPKASAPWNCGRCEKCVRTAAGFVVAGSPQSAYALLGRELKSEDLARIRKQSSLRSWQTIAAAAEDAEIDWLARAARDVVRRLQRRRAISRSIPSWSRSLLRRD